MSKYSEMNSDDLPPALESAVKKIIMSAKASSLPLKVTPKGAADHYIYKISIKDGMNEKIIECNQNNIQDDLKSLIRYVEKGPKKKSGQ